MAVRYINVRSSVDMFSPVVRATGNVVVIGAAAAGTDNKPEAVTSPTVAATLFGPAMVPDPADPERLTLNSALTASLVTLFGQSPGPAQVWGVKAASATGTEAVADPTAALSAIEELDVHRGRPPLRGPPPHGHHRTRPGPVTGVHRHTAGGNTGQPLNRTRRYPKRAVRPADRGREAAYRPERRRRNDRRRLAALCRRAIG